MSKPVSVFLRGAWHTPRCWDRLIAQLEAAGCYSVAPALPSSGSTFPTPDWSQVAKIIRDTVSSLVKNRDVVVVTQSRWNCAGGPGQDKSTSKGLKGGVWL